MIRKFLLAGSAIVAISGIAHAADMPLKAVAAPVGAYDWSGIYLGGVVGGAWGTDDLSDPGLGIVGTLIGVPVIQTNNSSGFIGGVEVGSRYQFGKLVVGWEGDVTWGHLNTTSSTSFGPAGIPFTQSLGTNINWTGTGTATVGVAHNNWLLYGKAGAAVENTSFTENTTVLGIPLFSGSGSDNNRVGWTVGTGIEYALWNSWSVKVEYDYLDFGTRNVAINGSILGLGIQPGLQDNSHINQARPV
jgi:outer membrane immunogenic protein